MPDRACPVQRLSENSVAGSREHTNGSPRQCWPKWKEFNLVPPEVQRLLGYRTPAEVFQAG